MNDAWLAGFIEGEGGTVMPDGLKCASAKAQVRRQKAEFKDMRKLQKECGKPWGKGHAYRETSKGHAYRETRHRPLSYAVWVCVCCGYAISHSPYVWQVVEREE